MVPQVPWALPCWSLGVPHPQLGPLSYLYQVDQLNFKLLTMLLGFILLKYYNCSHTDHTKLRTTVFKMFKCTFDTYRELIFKNYNILNGLHKTCFHLHFF